MANIFLDVKSFLSDVRSEIGKITWPSFDEFLGHMVVVFVSVAFSSVVLGLMDYLFTFVLTWFFSS